MKRKKPIQEETLTDTQRENIDIFEKKFGEWMEKSERQVARLEKERGEELKPRQKMKAVVGVMLSKLIALEKSEAKYKQSYQSKRGKLHEAESELHTWKTRALEAERELERRAKPEVRKVIYTRPGEQGLLAKFLGLFQFQDGNEAGPVAIIELSDGQIAEVGPQYLKMDDTKVTMAEPKKEPELPVELMLDRDPMFQDPKRPGDWMTIETVAYPNRSTKHAFVEMGRIENHTEYLLGVDTPYGCGVVRLNYGHLRTLYSNVAKAMKRIEIEKGKEVADDFPDITRE